MAKVDYIARETGHNLLRNLSLTLASIATVAVSLSLVGASLLLRQGVQNMTARWEGGIEFIVFVEPDATPEQAQALNDALGSSPAIESFDFVDQDAAFAEFQEMFRNTPEMIEAVSPDILPPSYRVVPTDPDAESIRAVGSQFEDQPGVYRVVFAFETVQQVQQLSRIVSISILFVAAVLLGAAGLLILNTIRMAMFARRREIEVMKLVGATNWFIRIPFMMEGLVQGIVGAVVAIGAVVALNNWLESLVTGGGTAIAILQGFVVDPSEVFGTSLFVFVVGVLVGGIGSGIAVSRYLDV
jgi:cell division transport system permease protein